MVQSFTYALLGQLSTLLLALQSQTPHFSTQMTDACYSGVQARLNLTLKGQVYSSPPLRPMVKDVQPCQDINRNQFYQVSVPQS